MSDFSTIVGKRIKQCRMKANFTQQEIADKLGVIRQSYVNVEKGERPLKDEEISILAKTLGTTTDYLLNGTETENIDICAVTGLSNEAVSFFQEMKKKIAENGGYYRYYSTIVDGLNYLLSMDTGNKILHDIGCYLKCDFSQAYTDTTSDGSSFDPLPVRSGIGFEIKNAVVEGHKTYQFYKPELLEQSAELLLIKHISGLKKELQQDKPDLKKRVRKVKE